MVRRAGCEDVNSDKVCRGMMCFCMILGVMVIVVKTYLVRQGWVIRYDIRSNTYLFKQGWASSCCRSGNG